MVVLLAPVACGREGDDPLSPTHSIIARTGASDLTTAQFDTLLATIGKREAMTVTGAVLLATHWTDIHRLALAAAHHDTLGAYGNYAIAPTVENIKADRFLKALVSALPADSATERAYASAARGVVGIRHIFLAYVPGMGSVRADSVKEFAKALRARLTPANFASMASRYSDDKNTAQRGGTIGLVPQYLVNRGLYSITTRLALDSISIPIESPLGVDIIQRMSWNDVRAEYPTVLHSFADAENAAALSDLAVARAEVTLTKFATALARAAVVDRNGYSTDETVIATYDRDGAFTVSQLVGWLSVGDPRIASQLAAGATRLGDDQFTALVENSVGRSILARSADSAGIAVSEAEKAALRDELRKEVVAQWQLMGITPDALQSAGDVAHREALASARVDEFLKRKLMEGEIRPVHPFIQRALDRKLRSIVSIAAIRAALKKE
jgi:hypothetical protein